MLSPLATSLLLAPALQSSTLLTDVDTSALNASTSFSTQVVGPALGRLWVTANPQQSEVRVFTSAAAGAPLQPFPITPPPIAALVDVHELSGGRAVLTTGFRNSAGELTQVTNAYVTDGTPGGTQLLPLRLDSEIVVAGGRAYFLASDLSDGEELRSTDGTLGGTRIELDLTPGSQGTRFTEPEEDGERRVFATSTHVYFGVVDGVTDTVSVRALPLAGGPATVVQQVPSVAVVRLSGEALGSRFVYSLDSVSASSIGAEAEPRVSDGTLAGTQLLADIAAGPTESRPLFLAADGARVWFTAWEPATGRELWRTDGTPTGTSQIVDLAAGSASSDPARFFSDGSRFYFVARDLAGVPLPVLPWSSDGTAAGTVALVPTAPGPAPERPSRFAAFAGRVFFGARFADTDSGVFSTDGSPQGTVFEADLEPDFLNDSSEPEQLFAADGQVFFKARRGGQDRLLVTDGTPGDARSLVTLNGSDDVLLGTLGNLLIFYREDAAGNEPWVSDGTLDGTRRLADLDPSQSPIGPLGSFIGAGPNQTTSRRTAVQGTRLFFAADTSAGGPELFVTDGTPEGTELFFEAIPGIFGLDPRFLTPFGDELAFVGSSGGVPFSGALWLTDGTSAGTREVAPLPSQIAQLVATDEHLFGLSQGFPIGDASIFRSDGTAAGTVTVLAGEFSDLAVVGERVVAMGKDGVVAIEPDGSVTSLLVPPSPIALSFLSRFSSSNDRGAVFEVSGDLLFPVGLRETWFTDGTPAGTRRIDADARSATVVGSGPRVALSAFEEATGREPRASVDGSDQLQLLADAAPGVDGTAPRFDDVARLGDALLYAATDPVLGVELHSLSVSAAGGYVAEPYGKGCGTNGAVRLDLEGEARLGEAVAVTLEGARAAGVVGLYAAGAPTLQPLDGCTLLIDGLLPIGSAVTDAAGAASLPFQLSTNPFWVGRELYLQALVIAPGGPVGGLLEVTNGLELVFGQ